MDRVFVCCRWDSLFPHATLKMRAIIGSDHSPLILDAGLDSPPLTSRFQFDASWLLVEGICNLISNKISSLLAPNRRSFRPMDDWHHCLYSLRKFFRGWARNRAAEARRRKSGLLDQISALHVLADGRGLSANEWQLRYDLEEALVQLHRHAEIY